MNLFEFIRKYAFVGFLLALTSTLVLKLSLGPYYSSAPYAVSLIQGNVDHELSKLQEQLGETISIIHSAEEITFSDLLQNWDFPMVVYSLDQENDVDSVYFWSDYHAGLNQIYFESEGIHRTSNSIIHVSHKTFQLRGRRYQIQALLPIYSGNSLNNKYLTSEWNPKVFTFQSIEVAEGDAEDYEIRFSGQVNEDILDLKLTLSEGNIISELFAFSLIGLLLIAVVFLTVFIFDWAENQSKASKPVIAFCGLIAGFVGLIVVLEMSDIADWLYKSALFDSRHYASSQWSSSFGELIINTWLTLLLAIWIWRNGAKLLNYNNDAVKIILYSVLTTVTIVFNYEVIRSLFDDSSYLLGIQSVFELHYFHVLAWSVFVVLSISYFLLTHSLFKLLVGQKVEFSSIIIACILLALMLFFFQSEWVFLPILNLAYFSILNWLDLPDSIEVFQFKTFIYLFTGAAICSLVAAFAAHNFESKNLIDEKKAFASNLLNRNDNWMEKTLFDAMQSIKVDRFIESRMSNRLMGKESVIRKIDRLYLTQNVFDKYDKKIVVFDAKGNPLSGDGGANYFELKAQASRIEHQTEFDNIYLLKDLNFNRYLSFLEFSQNNNKNFIAIQLRLKRVVPNSVFLELFMDDRYKATLNNRDFEYAWFDNGVLQNNSGRFPMNLSFDRLTVKSENEGISIDGKHLLHYQGEDEQEIIVASSFTPYSNLMSNFSFFYVSLLLLIFVGLIFFSMFVRWQQFHLNYATKIQLYINSAFFIPLMVVCLVTYQLVSSAYERDLQEQYLQKAKDITLNLNEEINSYFRLGSSDESLEEAVREIAKYTVTDINVYNRYGSLMAFNRALIFEKHLLSRKLNPEAFARVIEQHSEQIILDESIGDFTYKATYEALRDADKGDLIGVLSIPFFESKEELRTKLASVISNITNIFTVIFLLSLIVSYLASKNLTFPLRFIAQKITSTDLQERNEPLSWNSDDEIGLLVGSYNNMIAKLEESKEALSRSEKESAWREMAKQVAHEIKNPLTPMKLTLQHLQRVLSDNSELKEEVDKPVRTLLRQIETLSDIATSFSSFAKMPVPINERFDISALLRQTISLYKNDGRAEFIVNVPEHLIMINGDEKLIGRSLTNLILNGIQAVPDSRRAELEVGAMVLNDIIRVKIKDNGKGISEEIHEKVFMPNFSTKDTGSGIGLAVAKRGVEHAGGKIWFDTIEGEGTTFYLEFPIIAGSQA